MKKNGKKVLITASIFTVAVNMNGCGMYGPPEDYEARPFATATPTVAVQEQTPTDVAAWYGVTERTYAVFRLVTVPDKADNNGLLHCKIEMQSYYNGNGESLEALSEVYLLKEYGYMFSKGDIVFARLEPVFEYYGEFIGYRIKNTEEGVHCLPYRDNKLQMRWEFAKTYTYEYLKLYNEEVSDYLEATKAGEEFYMEFAPDKFYDGITVEETAMFFEALKKAKENYDVYLEEQKNSIN